MTGVPVRALLHGIAEAGGGEVPHRLAGIADSRQEHVIRAPYFGGIDRQHGVAGGGDGADYAL